MTTNDAGHFLYAPAQDYHGLDRFTYAITDDQAQTSQSTVTVLVKPVNQPPVAQDQSFVLNRNASQDITFEAIDPDSTQLTFSVVDQPKHGTLYTYPAVATYYPDVGFFGSDSFTYRANDGLVDGPIATVRLTVRNANNPPQVINQQIGTRLNRPVPVLLQATDLDSDPVTFQIVAPPVHGRLAGPMTNLVYQPAPGYLGQDAFTFKAWDGHDFSTPGTITVTITDQNSAPVATDLHLRMAMNSSTNLPLPATDLESDPLRFQILEPPHNGKLVGNGGTRRYTPDRDYYGPDRFTFRANDGQLNSQPATVSIQVDSLNVIPVATNQTVLVPMNTPTSFHLQVSDPDRDALQTVILQGPQSGRLSGLGATFTFVPVSGFSGTDQFTYETWDGQAYSNVGQVQIQVTTGPPAAILDLQSIALGPGGVAHFLVSGTAGHAVQIWSSTNLLDWSFLKSAGNNGDPFSVTDTNVLGPGQRFYRARQD